MTSTGVGLNELTVSSTVVNARAELGLGFFVEAIPCNLDGTFQGLNTVRNLSEKENLKKRWTRNFNRHFFSRLKADDTDDNGRDCQQGTDNRYGLNFSGFR